MLGNPASGCCRNEHRCSRNIERVRAVTTRADDVDEMFVRRRLNFLRQLTHHLRGGSDLANGFLLDAQAGQDRRRHQRRSEEHTSELQSLMRISYAVFCLHKKIDNKYTSTSLQLKT